MIKKIISVFLVVYFFLLLIFNFNKTLREKYLYPFFYFIENQFIRIECPNHIKININNFKTWEIYKNDTEEYKEYVFKKNKTIVLMVKCFKNENLFLKNMKAIKEKCKKYNEMKNFDIYICKYISRIHRKSDNIVLGINKKNKLFIYSGEDYYKYLKNLILNMN